jgi:uncharacterized protein YidB (DUF937 family)
MDMDINDLLSMGAKAFMSSDGSGESGSNLDVASIISALGALGGDSGFNITDIIAKMQQGELGDILQSWMGDDANLPISADQLSSLFGSDNVSNFASQLGVSEDEALGGLQEALPQIVDNASAGSELLDSIGGLDGVLGIAGKFFGR